MTSDQLRILIADDQRAKRLKIERLFNGFGFYCIYPTEKLNEVLSLCQHPFAPFDLLVVNVNQLISSRINNLDYLRRNTTIRHYLVYADRPTDRKVSIASVDSLPLDSSDTSIAQIMKFVLPSINRGLVFDAV